MDERARPACSVSLLGGFECRHHGAPVALPLTSQRVVAFLALHERPVLRAHVAGVLWPDSSQRRASGNLRSALWRLARFPFTLLVASSTHLGVDPAVAVDLREFDRDVRAIGGGGTAPSPDVVNRLLLAGDLLPEWDEDWLTMEREAVRQLRFHVGELLSRELAGRGRFIEATRVALSLIAAEPLRESSHRSLIEVFLVEGNLVEALRQYGRYRDLVRAELGVEPSNALRQVLLDAMRARDGSNAALLPVIDLERDGGLAATGPRHT